MNGLPIRYSAYILIALIRLLMHLVLFPLEIICPFDSCIFKSLDSFGFESSGYVLCRLCWFTLLDALLKRSVFLVYWTDAWIDPESLLFISDAYSSILS